jgi:hypothetical protein
VVRTTILSTVPFSGSISGRSQRRAIRATAKRYRAETTVRRVVAGMTAWRRTGTALVLGPLLFSACGGGESAPDQTSPSTVTSSAPTVPPTPEELAGEAATAALQEMLRVTDSARHKPTAGDWEPEIRRYAADPAAFLAVQSVRDFATIGLRQDGDTRIELEVADVQLAAAEGPSVRIAGCYDSSSTQVIDTGTSDVVPPGTPPRYVWDVTVVQYESEPGAPWLVTTLDPLTDQPC